MRATAVNGMEILKVIDVNVNTVADASNLLTRGTRRKDQHLDLHQYFKSLGCRKEVETFVNKEDKMFQMAKTNQNAQFDNGMDMNFGEDEDIEENDAIEFEAADGAVVENNNDFENFGIVVGEVYEIPVSKNDKNSEKKKRFQRIEELKQEMINF